MYQKERIRMMHSELLFLYKFCKEKGKSDVDIKQSKLYRCLIKDIRRLTKEHVSFMDIESKKHYDEDGTGYWELIKLPGMTVTEANEHFLSNYYRPLPVTQYDCTGKLFTSTYVIHKVPEGVIIYHSVQMDI